MIITATQKNTRQTALKVRLVANQVKKLGLVNALSQLGVIEKKSTLVVMKVVRQAIANAMHNHGYTMSELTLKNITVSPGQQYKRFRAVSRGRAHNVLKKTCHITVTLEAGVAPKAVEDRKEEKSTKKENKKETVVVEKTKTVAKKAVKKVAKPKKVEKK